MTDEALVWKKLSFIEACVHELRTLARVDQLATDVRERRFVEHTLQLAIQAALDVAAHIVSSEGLGEPETNKDLFTRLVAPGWLAPALLPSLRDMAGFRNILVHGYTVVDVRVLEAVVRDRLGDLLAFTHGVRQKLGGTAGTP